MNRDRYFHTCVDFLKLTDILGCGDGADLRDAKRRSCIDDSWSHHEASGIDDFGIARQVDFGPYRGNPSISDKHGATFDRGARHGDDAATDDRDVARALERRP